VLIGRSHYTRALWTAAFSILFRCSCNVTCGSTTTTPPEKEENSPAIEAAGGWKDRYARGTWDWSFEVAYLFAVVPNPWHCLIDLKAYDANVNDYKFVTQTLGLRYRLTDVEGPSFFPISVQLCGDVVVTEIVKGPESYFFGSAFGMHFDYVQRRWPVVPYVDFRIGPGGIDAAKGEHGQQSKFEFTYLWGAGLRYDISSSLSVSVGALDQHFSDAWLAPRNLSVDNVGVNIRLEKKF